MNGNRAASGVTVNENTALTSTAVFSAVDILSRTLASLPLPVYRRLQGGGKEKAIDHPLYPVLHDLANPEMTSFEFRQALMGHLCLWGNAYAEIERNNAGQVIALWPLRPDRMTVKRDNQGLLYIYQLPSGGQAGLRAPNIMHIRGLSSDGIIGYSPIKMAKEAIGLALATEEFGARFFGNGSNPGGVLQHPGKLSEGAAERLKKSWEDMHQGLSQSHRVAILEEGMTWQQVGIPPEDAQFLETRKFQVSEIARIFHVPPHMLGDLERATFSNIEEQSIEFVVHTMRPWLVCWEQTMKRDLFTPAEGQIYFAEFLVDGLLRGDIQSRYQAYAIGRQNGWLSADDIRELENMNPLPDSQGKVYLIPLNMVPADTVTQQSQQTQSQEQVEGRSVTWQSENEINPLYAVRAANIRKSISNSYKRIFADAALRCIKREEADIMRQARKAFGSRNDALFDSWLSDFYDGHKQFITDVMTPVFVSYGEATQAAAAEEVGGKVGVSSDLRKFIDDYTAVYVLRHVGKSIAGIRKALEDAISAGQDRTEALQNVFDDWRANRPQLIAQEEAVRAGNAFTLETYKENGVTKVRWVNTGDTCPYCRKLNGKVVGINKPYIAKGEVFEAEDEEVNGNLTGEQRTKKKRPPLTLGHDVKHPPAHEGCDCYITAERENIANNTANSIINKEKVYNVEQKLKSYSLNMSHPSGKNKAIAFERALGYNISNYQTLIEQIYQGIDQYPAVYKGTDQYGDKYEIVMDITGNNGKTAKVKTAWRIENDGKIRMVSAYVDKTKNQTV
ncbi:phage portal protein [Mahella australiensis]|nr:phage portal protein [Mahella australiensis]